MSIKTPEQLAAEALEAFTLIGRPPAAGEPEDRDVEEQSAAFIAEQIAEAIEADRAQRDLYELVAEELEDRAENLHDDEYPQHTETRRALARDIRNNDTDSLWCDYIGPMLDAMEEEYGR